MTEKKKIKPFADPGFTPVKNHIFDYIMPKLRPNAWKVLCVAIRQTLGWEDKETENGRKEEDEISYAQFMEGTGIGSKTTLSNAIKECLDKKYLKRRRTGKHPGTDKPIYAYRLNKEYEMEIPGTENVPAQASTESVLEASTETVLDESLASTESVLEASTETVLTKEKGKEKGKEKKESALSASSKTSVPSPPPPARLTTFQQGDDFLAIATKCEQARAETGGNYAVPLLAGGSDSLADHLVNVFCELRKIADLVGRERQTWQRAFDKILRRKRLSNDGTQAEAGLRVLLDPDNDEFNWYSYATPCGKKFQDDYGMVLGRILAGGNGYSDQFCKKKGHSHGSRQWLPAKDDPNYRVAPPPEESEQTAAIVAAVKARDARLLRNESG